MTQEASTTPPEAVKGPSELAVEAAYIVVVLEDGTYMALTDLTQNISVAREATRFDIRRSTRDIYENIVEQDQAVLTANMIIEAQERLKAEKGPSGSIRKALKDKGIL